MKNNLFTHVGIIVGCDRRTPSGFQQLIQLRETKLYWVSSGGVKFSKKDGCVPGTWPLHKLNLQTIKRIEND